MFCMKCKKMFPWECTCEDREERLASLSGKVVFRLPDGKLGTPAPVQPKPKSKTKRRV